ncbi:Hypothetical protein NTJ_09973 [Nesidiocoris tenuis]|uniref:Uncharacterized protein n=1 Tax=Nesidiocoris tenuis TaxID=355587 RepID=A0ABN7B042_9HEMI|nr:Hypothetical protein NTJ_09973 [Nesidiocoris tenuis]
MGRGLTCDSSLTRNFVDLTNRPAVSDVSLNSHGWLRLSLNSRPSVGYPVCPYLATGLTPRSFQVKSTSRPGDRKAIAPERQDPCENSRFPGSSESARYAQVGGSIVLM